MTEHQQSLLERFASGPDVGARWTAARELMAARQMVSAADADEFTRGLRSIGDLATTGSGLDRLIALDLIVRLSRFVKKIAPTVQDVLKDALREPLPPASLLNDSRDLPQGAKPAEFRENVAIALQHASGEWVIPYVVKSLVEEDKSQRCRLELAYQLAAREQSIDRWLEWVVALPLKEILDPSQNIENATTRLRDIAAALADTIRTERAKLAVSKASGPVLAKTCRAFVSLSPRSSLPKGLAKAAAEVARLVDEILGVRLTLIVEPEAYAAFETFYTWWQPLPYPKPVREAMRPVVDKLLTGITLRARWGQRSDGLATRLTQSLADPQVVGQRLRQIAEEEAGLTPEIDDWLRGHRRKTSGDTRSAVASLQAVTDRDLLTAIARLYLDAEETQSVLSHAPLEEMPKHARRLSDEIKNVAAQRGLAILGRQGDTVEYAPLAHESASGHVPSDPMVEIVRPGVVRRRHDGSEDIVVRAIVAEMKSRKS